MKRLAMMLTTLALAMPALAYKPGDRVDNFKLLDHKGVMHELYYYSDMKAVVIMIHGNSCPIVRNANHTFNELKEKYESQGVHFLMLNANLQDNRATINREAEEFGFIAPILMDETQVIAESFGVERTADTFVIDPKTWKVVYRGSLDDRLGYETQKVKAANHYVADALDAVLAGEAVKLAHTDAKGCLVNLPEQNRRAEHAKISYSEDVAPILIDKCVDCHRPGGIAPFAMNEYNMVRGFAPMIREVVRTKRMPPWHADPHYGTFSNDRSLSPEEVKTLVHWIEAGAPRGDGPDTLAQYEGHWPDWALGEPDVIIEIPAFDVPPTGIVDYLNPRVKSPFDDDVWVRAVAIQPGSRQAVHHVITTFGVSDDRFPGGFRPTGGLGGYVPGNDFEIFPEGTGVLLPKGAIFNFQMHYTPFGRPVTDKSRMGIYLHKEKPKYPLNAITVLNTRIKIPPYTKEHWESIETRPFERDAYIYTLLPHAHFRGKAASFVAKYPDGKEEILLSVPNYDFNWQSTYELAEPKFVPAGTTIVYNQSWDNSAQNPANPDPSREVPWGEQSFDEMLFGNIKYRWADVRPGDTSSGIGGSQARVRN